MGGSADQFQYAANVEHLHAGSMPVTPLDLLVPPEGRVNDYDDNFTASTRLGYTVTPGFDLNLVGRFTDAHYAFTGENPFVFPSFPGCHAEQERHLAVLHASERASGELRWRAG